MKRSIALKLVTYQAKMKESTSNLNVGEKAGDGMEVWKADKNLEIISYQDTSRFNNIILYKAIYISRRDHLLQ